MTSLTLADVEKIAHLAQKTENEFIGVKCGLMDQYISVFGQKEKALFLDCRSLRFKLIPIRLKQQGLSLVVYESGRHRELASSFYNERRQEAEIALSKLKKAGLTHYQQANLEILEELKSQMNEILYKRARHVIKENERVKKAVAALEKDDFYLLGQLLFQSHQSLKDDYQVSCPELDLLYEKGREFPGCLGARLTGAGFGGSGIALVENNQLEVFKNILLKEAEKRNFPQPRLYLVKVDSGAKIG
ncbi:MAG: galactokinase [Candidatus Aminicenantales bacterium]